MSAWMVSDAHLDLLATAWVQFIDPDADPQAIGAQFALDNAAAIRALYEDRHGIADEADEQARSYRFRRWLGNINPELLAKAIACFDYQCSAGDWKGRDSFAAVQRLKARCAAIGANWDTEPRNSRRFDAYPWGIEEEHRTVPLIEAGTIATIFRERRRFARA